MTKMLKLRSALSSILKEIHSNVYYEKADKEAEFPYVVFNLPNSTDDGTLEQFVLDVDCWDIPNKNDTTVLETIIGEIDNGLHRKTFAGNGLSFTVYRENRLVVEDDDPRIRRRKYIYQVRTFEKRGLN